MVVHAYGKLQSLLMGDVPADSLTYGPSRGSMELHLAHVRWQAINLSLPPACRFASSTTPT